MPMSFKTHDDTLASISVLDENNSLSKFQSSTSSFSFLFFGPCNSQNYTKENILKQKYTHENLRLLQQKG
jgi:hypothetical protein